MNHVLKLILYSLIVAVPFALTCSMLAFNTPQCMLLAAPVTWICLVVEFVFNLSVFRKFIG